jgi:hypothetical protein
MGLMDLFQQGDIRDKIYAAANRNNVPQGGVTGAAFNALFPHGLGNLAFGRQPQATPDLASPEGTQYMADLAQNMVMPGTFIGPKGMSNLLGDDVARGLLSSAEAKLAQGVPREEVFRELGVFKGPEGKWRYEIDDSGAKFRPEGLREFHNESSLVRQHRMMDHDELAKAYPDSGLIAYRKHGKSGAAYHDDSDTIFLPQDAGNPNMFPDLRENMRSMTHHELQHAVQGREGFAAGGSPQMFDMNKIADEVDINYGLRKLYESILDYKGLAKKHGAEADAIFTDKYGYNELNNCRNEVIVSILVFLLLIFRDAIKSFL